MLDKNLPEQREKFFKNKLRTDLEITVTEVLRTLQGKTSVMIQPTKDLAKELDFAYVRLFSVLKDGIAMKCVRNYPADSNDYVSYAVHRNNEQMCYVFDLMVLDRRTC